MTLEQAKNLTYHAELHYTGRRPCTITIGPRGGYTESITRCRVSGAVKTWKRDPSRVRVPVTHGLYEPGYITESNLADFHLVSECRALASFYARPSVACNCTLTHRED